MSKEKKLPEHVTRLPNGKYRVRYRESNKFPLDYSEIFDTEEEALEANKEYLAKVTLGVYNPNSKKDIGFSDFCNYVLDWYRNKPKQPSQNTIRFYKKYMNILKMTFKNQKLRTISTDKIENFLAKEKNRQKISNGASVGETISNNTLHHEFVVLRMILNKAYKWGYIEINPIPSVEEPTYEEKKIVVPEFSELETIENKIMLAPIRDRCQFLFAFYTGMRQEEVCGIHLENINRIKRTVFVETVIVQNELTGEYEEAKPKSKNSVRELPLPAKFFDVLDEYLEYREKFINQLKEKTNGTYQEIPNLFLNKDGHFYRPHRLSGVWSTFRHKNGIDLTFHGLRHYYLTNQMNYNEDLAPRDVQELGGHADIKTTYKYVHPSEDRIKSNATVLFDKFSRKELYKNGNDVLTIPISHIATIILGDPKYSDTEELQITLSELSHQKVDFFNISEIMENSKTFLQANYPSLERIEKYSYVDEDEKEILNSIKKEFGREFQVQVDNEMYMER